MYSSFIRTNARYAVMYCTAYKSQIHLYSCRQTQTYCVLWESMHARCNIQGSARNVMSCYCICRATVHAKLKFSGNGGGLCWKRVDAQMPSSFATKPVNAGQHGTCADTTSTPLYQYQYQCRTAEREHVWIPDQNFQCFWPHRSFCVRTIYYEDQWTDLTQSRVVISVNLAYDIF